MIARIWHGYTTKENAGIYENLLKEEIFPGIENKNIEGYIKIQLLKRDLGHEVEFTTIMWFDSIDVVKTFAGENYEDAYVPQKAREILLRFNDKATHYELSHQLEYL